MEKVPNKLRLIDGRVVLADGANATEYLNGFSERMNLTPETPVCLITKADLDDLLFHRHLLIAA